MTSNGLSGNHVFPRKDRQGPFWGIISLILVDLGRISGYGEFLKHLFLKNMAEILK